MEQLYEDWDTSYNELQEWLAVMQEYAPKIVVDL